MRPLFGSPIGRSDRGSSGGRAALPVSGSLDRPLTSRSGPQPKGRRPSSARRRRTTAGGREGCARASGGLLGRLDLERDADLLADRGTGGTAGHAELAAVDLGGGGEAGDRVALVVGAEAVQL